MQASLAHTRPLMVTFLAHDRPLAVAFSAHARSLGVSFLVHARSLAGTPSRRHFAPAPSPAFRPRIQCFGLFNSNPLNYASDLNA